MQQGDEWCHWVTDMEGNLLVKDEQGNYHVATAAEEDSWKTIKAHNLMQRDEVNQQRQQQRRAGQSDPQPDIEGGNNHAANFPSKGQIHGLIVLVQYDDVSFANDSATTLQHYEDMIKKEGYNEYDHQGSAHDFFFQNSMGQFDPQFDIYGPITLKNKRSYYGGNNYWGNDQNPQEMVIEACQQLDSLVDFSIYDNNNDGVIDFVFAFYAGGGEHAGEGTSCVWPHAWSVSAAGGGTYKFDNVKLDSYACSCETLYGQYDGVGTFCHEFTHVLGLPDIYDVNYSSNTFTPGSFDVLDQGSYNGLSSGSCPAGINTYERYELGWIEPERLVPGSEDTLTWLGESNRAFILPVKSSTSDPRDGEYYLFENRQKTGWDSFLPGHGMLVWHIDYQANKWYSNNVNTTANHQCVDIVEADDKKNVMSQGGDPFPGTKNITRLTPDTKPALLGWDSHSSRTMKKKINGAALNNIHELQDSLLSEFNVISFKFTDYSVSGDTLADGSIVLLDDQFADVKEGNDKEVNGSSTPFEGSENFPIYDYAFQAGNAIRLGNAKNPGSITTRTLGNVEGSTLDIEISVKGWNKVEGKLLVSYDNGEPVELDYASKILDEYELVSCTLTECPANTKVTLATDQKRCFISSVYIQASIPASIEAVSMDQQPQLMSTKKEWRNGQLMISTGTGMYNMQGVRQ